MILSSNPETKSNDVIMPGNDKLNPDDIIKGLSPFNKLLEHTINNPATLPANDSEIKKLSVTFQTLENGKGKKKTYILEKSKDENGTTYFYDKNTTQRDVDGNISYPNKRKYSDLKGEYTKSKKKANEKYKTVWINGWE